MVLQVPVIDMLDCAPIKNDTETNHHQLKCTFLIVIVVWKISLHSTIINYGLLIRIIKYLGIKGNSVLLNLKRRVLDELIIKPFWQLKFAQRLARSRCDYLNMDVQI